MGSKQKIKATFHLEQASFHAKKAEEFLSKGNPVKSAHHKRIAQSHDRNARFYFQHATEN